MARRVELFRCLQGLLSIYKPPGQDINKFRRRIAQKIASEFNKLPWESERLRTRVIPKHETLTLPVITTEVDIVDNPLVVGQRFMVSDVLLNLIDPLPDFASGLQLIGVGDAGAYALTDVVYQERFSKYYHLTGMFGQATSDGLSTGSLIYRSPWRHITRPKLDRILASLEFKSRSAAMLQAGLLPNTQKAFDALSDPERLKRPLKPLMEPREFLPPDHVTSYWDHKPSPDQPYSLRAPPDPSSLEQFPPSIQAIRCISFEPPFFTLEMQVHSETESFLTDLMVNIGAALRSSCVLCRARRIRHGPFEVRDSLLVKHCVVPPRLYDRFASLVSQPPEGDFEGEGEYRHFLLGQLAAGGDVDNLFSNLAKCTLDERFQKYVRSRKEQQSPLLGAKDVHSQ